MDNHKFWKTQPIDTNTKNADKEDKPIEIVKIEDVRKDPYSLPEGFEWSNINLSNDLDIKEFCDFLNENYLEEQNLKFAYSIESIKWMLLIPDYFPELFIAVRLSTGKKIVATICGIPMDIKVNENIMRQVEINFLCISKKLRTKRLAPVMIKEVTRRTNLRNIFQAVYTANLELPNILATSRYLLRFINVKKLVDIGFTNINNKSMSMYEKLYKIKEPEIKMRPIENKDLDVCFDKLNKKLMNYNLTQIFDKKTFNHYFTNKENVIYTFVLETDNKITDMISFFIIDNEILNNTKYQNYKSAYMFYYFNESKELNVLMDYCLYYCKQNKIDVFNMLNTYDQESIVKKCKFLEGTGFLNYYLYNYQCKPFDVNKIALPIF
jgi:glycylpeptide N-tetradecanoyltransferase